MPATVTKVTGPLSYIVRTMDNQEWRRHKNQLQVRHIPDTQCSQNGIDDEFVTRNPIAESPTSQYIITLIDTLSYVYITVCFGFN